MRPITWSSVARATVARRISSSVLGTSVCAGSTHVESPEVDAGLLDVLHDAADDDAPAVGDRVDVDLDRLLEEAVDEDRAVGRRLDRVLHVAIERRVVVDDLHRAPAEYVARSDEHRIPDLARDLEGLRGVRGHPAVGLVEAELLDALVEEVAILRAVDRLHRGPDQGRSAFLSPVARFSGVWPPNCTMIPSGSIARTMFITSSCVSGSKKRSSDVS